MRTAEQKIFARMFNESDVTLTFYNSLSDVVTKDHLAHAHGVILAGSGDFDFDGGRSDNDEGRKTSYRLAWKMRDVVDHLFEQNVPTLGICFGHQIIGHLRGVSVVHDTNQAKVGSHEVMLSVDDGEVDVMIKGLPKNFVVQYGHKDSLAALPRGARVLAHNGRCNYSFLKYTDTMYTTQFHPELNEADVEERLRLTPSYLPQDGVLHEMVQPSPYNDVITSNFMELVQRYKTQKTSS